MKYNKVEDVAAVHAHLPGSAEAAGAALEA